MTFNKQSWNPHRPPRAGVRTRRYLQPGAPPPCTFGAAFNGTSSVIDNGGNDFTATAFTIGGYWRIGAATGSGIYVPISFSDANTSRLAIAYDWSGPFAIIDAAGGNAFYTGGGITANTTYALFISKAAGTATPRMHMTSDGTNWTHQNFGATLGDPNGTINRTTVGAEHLDAVTGKWFIGDIYMVGMWAEDTSDGAAQTYIDYSVLAAKTNAQFFTNTSLIGAGTLNDSGALNNGEISRANVSTGSNCLPSWITNFGSGGGGGGPGILPKTRMHRLVPIMQKQQY